MSWWMAKCLGTLLAQINRRFPYRDKASDGGIGDSAHAARDSDHNPVKTGPSKGVVRARDIDENFGKRGIFRKGRQARILAAEIADYAKSGLPGSDRVKYVVYEKRIASGTYKDKKRWWQWRPGNWGHEHHIHVSTFPAGDQDGQQWPLPSLAMSKAQAKKWRADLDAALKKKGLTRTKI